MNQRETRFRILPGLNGNPQAGDGLSRIETVNVGPSTQNLDFQWITSVVTFDVVDQNGVSIQHSRLHIQGVNDASGTDTPFTVTLPITDEAVHPTMSGRYVRGYLLWVFPAINAQADTYGLLRSETREVKAATAALNLEWICTRCPVFVVNGGGQEVPGSSFSFNGASLQNGDSVQLPVTDNATYPTIAGAWANGYLIGVKPGDTSSSDTFQFEVLPGGAFVPEWFTIDPKQYGLRFACNQPPKVDAGPNVSILSSQESTTTINGTATDADGNSLSYRWLEADTELSPWTPAGTGGACPLNLGSLAQSLPVGPHTLKLEVNDGTVVVSDTMILTVGNSPLTLVCAGNVKASVWSPVALNASVADFDGDTLSYTWSYGQSVVYQGTITAPSGGAPVPLPVVSYADGFDVGLYIFTLAVNDGVNPAVSCDLTVNVTDSEAPKLAPVANPAILWPPNHKMVDVYINTHATDNSRDPVTLTVDQIASTEDPDKAGDGHTIPDSQVMDINQATGVIHLQLRSERSGKGPGRTYTITITATDRSGNKTTVTAQVQAPHDKGK